jgi:hypothetical protein
MSITEKEAREELMILGVWELIGIVLLALVAGIVLLALVAGMFYWPCPVGTNVKDGEL